MKIADANNSFCDLVQVISEIMELYAKAFVLHS